MNRSRLTTIPVFLLLLAIGGGALLAQGLEPEPVFRVKLVPDREPLVAGEEVGFAVVLRIDRGWHINSNNPGDEFSVPTTVSWQLPDGWTEPSLSYPPGRSLKFDFSETPIEVWEGEVVLLAAGSVPEQAGEARLRVEVTAQACNDVTCLPPTPVAATSTLQVAPAGSTATPVNQAMFDRAASPAAGAGPEETAAAGSDAQEQADRLAALPFPLLLGTLFLLGLGLNLTPCIFPLIPITIGFFDQQTKDRGGTTFGLALAYVLGMAITYSLLGVAAALAGKLFGSALGHPLVIGLIVVVILALAASMFGLWELRPPAWAMQASGGRAGAVGALIMGLVVGFVAAPCIGPFVLGLITLVAQKGEPLFGFVVFFCLAMGLGLPFLLLGTFTGLVQKLPASGAWMIGVRQVFGFLLIGLAVHFARPLLPGNIDQWLMAAAMIVGGLVLLVILRSGHEQPVIDRIMRLLSVTMVVLGVLLLPFVTIGTAEAPVTDVEQEWRTYDQAAVQAAISSGRPVIIDFWATWCIPCKELEVKTFADPQVAGVLAGYERFKSDQTLSNERAESEKAAHGVAGVPTVIVYRGGEERFRIVGFEPPKAFLERLQRLE